MRIDCNTMPVCHRLIWMLLAAAATCTASAAEPAFRCAGLLPSATRTPAYTRAAGEARCEGFFDGTVSQPFIELLSLTRQRPDALPVASAASSAAPAAASPTTLRLEVGGHAGVQVVIQPLRSSPFYRVDAALAAGQALAWNATTMLASTGLRVADLGFLARSPLADAPPGSPAALRVTPISLAAMTMAAAAGGAAASAAAASAPGTAAPASAYAVLRVSVAVDSVAARSVTPGRAGGSDWRKLPGSRLDAWDTVVLPITLNGDAAAETHVDVRAVDPGGQLLPLLQFTVVGR